jgi:hypothetical protein
MLESNGFADGGRRYSGAVLGITSPTEWFGRDKSSHPPERVPGSLPGGLKYRGRMVVQPFME